MQKKEGAQNEEKKGNQGRKRGQKKMKSIFAQQGSHMTFRLPLVAPLSAATDQAYQQVLFVPNKAIDWKGLLTVYEDVAAHREKENRQLRVSKGREG